MTLTLDRTDDQLRERVTRQLGRSRDVEASGVKVLAQDGTITLTGTVRSYPERVAAEDAVKRLFGVRGIHNLIEVTLAAPVDDQILERDANAALARHMSPHQTLEARVRRGIVSLSGTVAWLYQRHAAEAAVMYLPGVRGIENRIALTAVEPSATLRDEVERALIRTAGLDWKCIQVSAHGGTVHLAGRVYSLREKEDAERAAWANPAVTGVESSLEVTSRRWW